MDMGYMYCIFKLLLQKFIKARGCYLRNSYSLTNSFLRMVLLLPLLPSSTWLPAWLYSSCRFLPAGLMVSLLFLLSVLLRNLYARNFIFLFSPNLYFSLGSRNSFYLFPDTRNFSCWFTQPIAPVFGSLTHKISRNLIAHCSCLLYTSPSPRD